VTRLDRWLLTPAPPQRLAALRMLVGGYATTYLALRAPGFLQMFDLPRHRFDPVGPLWFLAAPLSPGVMRAVLVVTIAAGVAFVAGWRWRITGPAFALLFLAVTAYRMSWGHVIHVDQLPALHLLVLGFTPAAVAWSTDARRAGRTAPAASDRFGWPIRIMAVITVVAYVLAGIAKVRNGGLDWMTGDVLRNHVAYDNLRKILLGSPHSPVGGWLAANAGAIFTPLAVLTVAVELGAPVALVGGRVRTIWVASAWAFHVGIVVLMAISFPYQLLGIAYAPFFRAERVIERARSLVPGGSGRRGRARAPSRSPASV
jgi:hypothetical protein